MSQIDILFPFSLPPAELAGDLLRELKAPALALLTTRAKSRQDQAFNEFSRALPHETWLARQYGLAPDRNDSPPLATTAMRALGLNADAGTWFMLQPAHLHVARDHLVLTDQRRLQLTDHESRALFDAAQPLFEEAGRMLRYGAAHAWFMRADDWQTLHTSTMDAACGRNIDIWMPQGQGERDWRKLQNEVHMLWHAHSLNQQREHEGLQPVNSLWISAGAPAGLQPAPGRYADSAALERFAARLTQTATASSLIATAQKISLAIIDSLIEPALAGDWSTWLQRFNALEAEWFTPLLQALKAGKIESLSLILTHGTHLSEFLSNKRSVAKFWVKPALSNLIR